MPALILDERSPGLVERMDDPTCDREMLDRTFEQFDLLNRMLAGWGRIWRRHLKGALMRPGSALLDIGCGGGDVIRYLAERAESDGLDVMFTGIDPDVRAIEFARSRTTRPNIRYCNELSGDQVSKDERYEAVISNHVLHHLDTGEFDRLLSDSRALARGPVVHNDIRRDDLAPVLFQPARLLFRNSFIVEDGIRSIRRAYTDDELQGAAGPVWTVRRQFPFRLLLTSGVGE